MNEITIQGIPSFFAEYTGRPITFPSLSVFCDGTRLTETADYTVIYYNNTEPGIASLAIMGTGTYDFRKDILFTIIRTDEDPGREAFRAGPDVYKRQVRFSVIGEHAAVIGQITSSAHERAGAVKITSRLFAGRLLQAHKGACFEINLHSINPGVPLVLLRPYRQPAVSRLPAGIFIISGTPFIQQKTLGMF